MGKGRYISAGWLLIVLLVAFACSPKTNYKTLSFFFDGVPDPFLEDSIARADSIRQAEVMNTDSTEIKVAQPEMVFHPPYQEKECAFCHDQTRMGKLLEPMPGLCYQCHEDFAEQYQILHGPVGGGFCTECHNPHKNQNQFLLKRTGQDLCYYCHLENDVLKNEMHEDIEDADCTECHNPHGGEDRYIFN